MGEKYTKEKHEAFRKEQDEKAAKEEEARKERLGRRARASSFPIARA